MSSTFYKLYLIFFLTTIICTQSFAQDWKRELYFKNISSNEGLSIPTISCFAQDSRGYIWVGTVDGLNRYDGYEFKVYLPDPKDANSIPSNRIDALYEDDNYNLWIGTPEGLSQFNYKTEQFTTYKSDDEFLGVVGISHDKKNNRIWLTSANRGLKYLDLDLGIVKTFTNEKLKNAICVSLLNVKDDVLYIGTYNNGVYTLNLNSFAVEEFCNTKTGKFQISSDWIRDIHFFDEHLFIGTNGGGLIVNNLKNEQLKRYLPQNSLIPSESILAIAHDQDGDIFIGTNKGLAIYNFQDELVSVHQKENGNTTALSSNTIRALFVDKNDDLWVGTLQKGINFQHKESRDMVLVQKKFDIKNSLSGNNITAFAQDNNGGIWIGTRETGLNYYKDGKYTHYKADGILGSLPDNEITDICIDHRGLVWVSTLHGGISMLKNGKIVKPQSFLQYNQDYSQSNVRKLDVDKYGILWIATMNGLDSYGIENKEFKHHFLEKGNRDLTQRKGLRTILVGLTGDVYVGTSNGLYCYNPVSGTATHYQKDPKDSTSLGHNIIMEIFEDSRGRIWLGSLGGGLMLFEQDSGTFKNYSPNNGFPSGSGASIQEDNEGNLWIGTSDGIVKFFPETEQSLTLGKSQGLQDLQFTPLASLKCNDGRLIFGGIKGFNVFRPAELEMKGHQLDVVITDLKLFNKSVPILGESNILTQNIGLLDYISMLYRQAKYFSIAFSALQFSDPDQVQYKYMLDGFDDDWNFIGNQHQVSFSNLDPGNYELKIMASENGVWDNKVKEFGIKIIPPFYMETWFKGSVILISIIFIVSFYFYKVHDHKVRQIILERLVEEKNKEITYQNEELLSTNEELHAQNEEVLLQKEEVILQKEEVILQKEFISNQNTELSEIHFKLKEVNLTLEKRVELRTMELKESNIKLNKTVMDLDRFVYSASHDLSAPLKSVLGLVHIAKLESKEKNLEVHLNYIEQSIKKQEKVIRSLIQYSRNSRQEIKTQKLNLYGIVDQIISELKYMPGSDCVKITNEVAKEVSIISDAQRILTILNNLLSNGIHFRDKDRTDSFVKIHCLLKAHSWQLIVKDNGQGIAEDQQGKIFEMFYRANEESDGSGLGLFIVKEAVDKLDGKISLKSTLASGSEFMLEFPNR